MVKVKISAMGKSLYVLDAILALIALVAFGYGAYLLMPKAEDNSKQTAQKQQQALGFIGSAIFVILLVIATK